MCCTEIKNRRGTNEVNAREVVEEEQRNTEEARRNKAEEKRKCLELEAELWEMRMMLKPQGNT
jgi:hypothetical protein